MCVKDGRSEKLTKGIFVKSNVGSNICKIQSTKFNVSESLSDNPIHVISKVPKKKKTLSQLKEIYYFIIFCKDR